VSCDRTGCTRRAKGALGFEFYPPRAVMQHYRTTQPLTRFIVGLNVCHQHLREVDPIMFLGVNVLPLLKVIQARTGTAVDLQATKAVLVAFDDPEYLRLQEARQKGAAA
jgi:hypothetical protein